MTDSDSPRQGKAPTRQRILEAALRAFAAQGLQGARVDEIAASARVNKRMLYHHFGDKAGLFQAVLDERVLTGLASRGNQRDLAWLREIPADAWRMLVWDAQTSEQWALTPLLEAVAARQQAGEWRSDVSAQVMALCLVGAYALPGLLGCAQQFADPQRLAAELADLFSASPRTDQRPRVRIKPTVQLRGATR